MTHPRPGVLLSGLLLMAACHDRAAPHRGSAAAAPLPAAARDQAADTVLERVLAWDDTVRVIRDTVDAPPQMAVFRLRVNQQTLLEDDLEGMRIYALLPDPDSVGTLVLVQVVPGGTGCEAQYALVEVGDSTPRATDYFGDCGAFPDLTLLPDGLRLFFPGWLPTAVLMHPDEYPHAHADPETYEYRHGRLRKLRSVPRR